LKNTELKYELFFDKNLQKSFDKNGFVSFPLLDSTTCDYLVRYYEKFKELHILKENEKFHTTAHSNNWKLIEEVSNIIIEQIADLLNKVLKDVNFMHSVFMAKESGEDSTVAFHQDLTYVDEINFFSGNCWIALDDVNEENGCLRFIPGSHLFPPVLRTAPDYNWPFENVKTKLDKYAVNVTLPKGHCVVFLHSTVHGSLANTTSKTRLSSTVGFYSKKSPLTYSFKQSDSVIEVYDMHVKDFFFLENDGRPPKLPSSLCKPYKFYQVQPNQLSEIASGNRTIFSRIKSYFKND